MPGRVCSHCGAQDYGTPFCVSCQKPFVRDQEPDPSEGPPAAPGEFAGFSRRFFAFFFDVILLSVLADLVSLSFSLGSGDRAGQYGVNIPAVISFSLFVLYFTLFTADGGQTPGKKLLGIRVVRIDGGDISPRISFFRTLSYLLSAFFGTFLGFLWVLWDRRRRAWHDRIAGTVVVRKR
ncbi:MAG: RDD family protein [Proteobacteria bacterium]|nr:RDD family protein [Pseudomonadota bacterium]